MSSIKNEILNSIALQNGLGHRYVRDEIVINYMYADFLILDEFENYFIITKY